MNIIASDFNQKFFEKNKINNCNIRCSRNHYDNSWLGLKYQYQEIKEKKCRQYHNKAKQLGIKLQYSLTIPYPGVM